MDPRKPIVLAFVPCREVVRRRPSSPATIIEATWTIRFDRFPGRIDKLMVYLAVTNLRAAGQFTLRLGPADPGIPGAVMEPLQIDALPAPNQASELTADLHGWPVTSAGQWVLDLLWDGESLLARRLEMGL